jgi:hypothetical protein
MKECITMRRRYSRTSSKPLFSSSPPVSGRNRPTTRKRLDRSLSSPISPNGLRAVALLRVVVVLLLLLCQR